ncbi:MAG: hypothetical protein C4290_12175 [Chloroflexota bacterium]
MKRVIAPTAALVAALALLLLSGTSMASAHERRTVAGKYVFVVGFLNEPALVEEPNGIDLRVTNAQTNEPVEGLEKTLKAEIIVGDQKKTVDLRARFGQKGAYTADIIPTKAGTWAFRFFGTVEGTPVDERFESGPGRFNDVQPKRDLQFPVQLPTLGELAQQRMSAPETSGRQVASPAEVQRALDRAETALRTALILGLVGIGVGLLGVGLAVRAQRARAPMTASPGRGPESV